MEFILDSMPFPIWIMDENTDILYTNKIFKKKYLVDSLKDVIEYIANTGLLLEHKNKIIKAIKNKENIDFEIKIGEETNICYISPYSDEKNTKLCSIGIFIDMTELKREQRKLEERENILRTIIDTLPDYIFYKDRDCKYIGYNKKWKEHYKNQGVESMVGKSDFDRNVLTKEQAENFFKDDLEVMNTKKGKIIEYQITSPNGELIYEETKKVPVVDEKGEVWGLVGIASDITEKHVITEKLLKLSYTD